MAQAVIIAGGKGTRLRPLTYGCPKPMLPLLDRPFLQWLVERCVAAGVTDILVNVHYQALQVREFLGDGKQWGAQIRYIEEVTPLDTAGAITLARPYFTGEPLLVFNADILTDLDLRALLAFHHQHQNAVTLTLTRVEDITPYGLVELDSNSCVLAFREKPTPAQAELYLAQGINTINAGTYVIQPDLFALYPLGEPLSFERVFFPDILDRGYRMMGFVWEGYWLDVGTPQKFYQAQLDILQGKVKFTWRAQMRSPGIWVGENTNISDRAILHPPCYIGDNSYVGEKAVIPPGTIVGANSWLNNCLAAGVYPPGTLVL
ncbi:MAG: NDP-sugar synthase [Pseudanabaenaceae cyanobacterium SKYGB_i_bin29]|nr:NDP-sugar synthase [Pseudanabaenaceae cyanobacterium SKYG29]MDW8420524.1 NDP-sugar synthase [Pseudanabaenaceae cyanobacterium SKYGB_i_bin29]